jgi:hypothetical protein
MLYIVWLHMNSIIDTKPLIEHNLAGFSEGKIRLVSRLEMLWTQTNPGLCALAQMASRRQTALVSGLGCAVAPATGRPPSDLCHRQRPRNLPDHDPSGCRLIKPKPFCPGRILQNVQTPAPLPFRRGEGRGEGSLFARRSRGTKHAKWSGCSLSIAASLTARPYVGAGSGQVRGNSGVPPV